MEGATRLVPDEKELLDDGTGDGTGAPEDGAEEPEGSLGIVLPKVRKLMVTISGKTDLLTCRISEQEIQKIQKIPIPKDQEWNQQQIFEARIYRDHESRPSFPGSGVMKAMVDAARSLDQKMTMMKQLFTIPATFLPILDSEPRLRTDPAKNKQSLVMAVRAEYRRPWRMIVPIEFNASMASEKDILALLGTAGFAVGIGAWRREKNGLFGQFEIEKFARAPISSWENV